MSCAGRHEKWKRILYGGGRQACVRFSFETVTLLKQTKQDAIVLASSNLIMEKIHLVAGYAWSAPTNITSSLKSGVESCKRPKRFSFLNQAGFLTHNLGENLGWWCNRLVFYHVVFQNWQSTHGLPRAELDFKEKLYLVFQSCSDMWDNWGKLSRIIICIKAFVNSLFRIQGRISNIGKIGVIL